MPNVAITVNFGSSQAGLSTVGYQLFNPDGSANGGRITAGVLGLGGGSYTATASVPTAFIGVVRWDTGTTPLRVAASVIALGNNTGTTQFQLVGFGSSQAGLLTVGYQLVNADATLNGGHVTSGIVDFGYGYYGALVAVPYGFSGLIVWDTGGSSPRSASAPLTGPPLPALSAGTISVTGVTDTSISLFATEATGGTSPYTHQWQRRVGSGAWTTLGASGLSVADTGLSPGVTYTYQLRYTDAASHTVTATKNVTTTGAPLTAGTISVNAVTQTSVALTSSDATGGQAPYSYQWQRSSSQSGPFTALSGQMALSISDTGLTPGATYFYRLVTTDAASVSVSATQAVTLPGLAPSSGLSSYPNGSDLYTFLTAMGFTIPAGMDLDAAARAGADAWEQDTRLHPFLAASDTRFFDPPGPRAGYGGWRGGEKTLQLYTGLLSVTSLSIGLSADDAVGFPLTQGKDFFLRPDNVDKSGRPFTAIEFRVAVYGEAQSVAISGVFGAMTTLTSQIWDAILRRGALLVFPELQYSRHQGAQRIKEGDEEIAYEVRLLASTPNAWQKIYDTAVAKYKLRTLV